MKDRFKGPGRKIRAEQIMLVVVAKPIGFNQKCSLTTFLNTGGNSKQHFVSALNGLMYYLLHTCKAIHVLGIWTPVHL